MDTTVLEDALMVIALKRLSDELRAQDDVLAARAWWLAVGIAEEHGVELE